MLKATLVLCVFLGSALCTDLTISSMTDFDTFSKSPNSYNNVYLSADLDFSNVSNHTPISNFAGTFDGQGHIIKNLKINSTEEHVGIFGSLTGAKIKNLIIDSSCSMTSSPINSTVTAEAYLGSVVGQCKRCTFENIINHASVTFTNSSHAGKVHVGGIAGGFSYDSGASKMENVANYGAVTNELTNNAEDASAYYIATGGLIGYSISVNNHKVTLTNCINYGTVFSNNTNNGKTYTAGIIGYVVGNPEITKTVSAGTISSQTSNATGIFIGYGSTSGSGSATFANCYYMNDLGVTNVTGFKSGFTATGESDVVEFSGHFSGLKDGNVWIYNPENETITFNVNNNTAVKLSSTLIVAPVLADRDGNHTFKGWFTDEYCTVGFDVDDDDSNPTNDTILRGGWEYTVTFDENGGAISESVFSKTVIFNNKIGDIPTPTRTGYTFDAWYDAQTGGNVVNSETAMWAAENVTIYAHWIINNYTITFVYENGTNPTTVTLDYDATIVLPSDPTRTEYTFLGWSMTNEFGISEVYTKMPAYDLTITADWLINNYTVTFVFYEGHANMSDPYDYNSSIDFPLESDTHRPGYTFNGWDDNVTKIVPSGGITFIGNWTINTYVLTIDFNNGTDPLVYELEYNETIDYPENVTKKGSYFNRWNPNPTTMPAENLTVTVEWTTRIWTYTFLKDGKSVQVNHTFDSVFEPPSGPSKSLHKFKHWCYKNSNGVEVCGEDAYKNPPTESNVEWVAKFDLNTGAVAGIAVACAVVVIAIATVGVILFVRRKKATRKRKAPKKKDVEMES